MVKIMFMCLPVNLCACVACDVRLFQNAHFIFSAGQDVSPCQYIEKDIRYIRVCMMILLGKVRPRSNIMCSY